MTRILTLLCTAVFALLASRVAVAADTPLMNALFQDHAVLQRGAPIAVWGEAAPGASVTVTLASATAVAKADASGRWSVTLPAMAAGGPYTLSAASDDGAKETAADVLIGDVWLCAGQSNMVLQVNRTLNSRAEIENAHNDTIRMLAVPDETSLTPLADFPKPLAWETTTPETVGNFSAACYYFARELQKTIDVPLGLINASWGGANIRTWMSLDAIHKVGGDEAYLQILDLYRRDPAAATARWGQMWEDWWRARVPTKPGSEPWSPTLDVSSWATAPEPLTHWDDWNIPALSSFAGQVWYRTIVMLTADEAAKAATLSLGAINEEDETWVNGKPVGNMFGYGTDRSYALPAGALHAGDNTIVVNVLCTYRGCGMFGDPAKRAVVFADGSRVPLAGPWHYEQVVPDLGPVPRAPWGAVAGFAMAYNAMIAPLGDFGLKGAIWYQGESNAGEPMTYGKLLAGLMADWRARFGTDLPFLIVQLPDYGAPPTKPEASRWARLRDMQREVAASDPHAALVVTIDIGAHSDIHPADKQDLGKRLTRAALYLVYGEPIVPGGPVALRAVREGNRVVVSFADTEGGLIAYDAPNPIGFELCGATEASCRYANAHIAGARVSLDVPPHMAPTNVRYCWADGPICTLFDGAGLPAGPFDLPVGAGALPRAAGKAARL